MKRDLPPSAVRCDRSLSGHPPDRFPLAAGETPSRLAELSARSAGGFVFLVVGGAVFGFSYRWLLDNAPVSTVATHAYVNPLVASCLGR